jgi:hypothetical protein
MSLSAMSGTTDLLAATHSAATSAFGAAPRLTIGQYATWRPRMEAHLMRNGLEETYSDEIPQWSALHARVREWDTERKRDAIAAALAPRSTSASSGGGGSGATTTSGKPTKGGVATMGAGADDAAADAEYEKVKKEMRALVDRSLRAYGILYEALPDTLRPQIAHIPAGYAYGVWIWLEKKYQNTETDCVNDLIQQWMEMKMDEDREEFDAYRARVNKLALLLEQAKEKPSARIYAYKMLDVLSPMYRTAVLALKAGDKLKDPATIDWEGVTAFLNAHARSELRINNAEGETYAMANSARTGGDAPRCYNCNGLGHVSKACSKPQTERTRKYLEARARETGDEGSGERGGDEVAANPKSAARGRDRALMIRSQENDSWGVSY